MARTANYEAKIATLTEKVEKKTAELKKLKEELSEIKSKKAKEDYKVLFDYMQENDISADDVLGVIKE
jgi:DNA-binding protein H-NS